MFNFLKKKKKRRDKEEEKEKEEEIEVEDKEEEFEEDSKDKKKFSKKLKIILLAVVVGAVVFFAIKIFIIDKKSTFIKEKKIKYIASTALYNIEIEDKILNFTYKNSISLYEKIVDLNSALQTISDETKRIEVIKEKYIKYSSIINPELIKLQKIKTQLNSSFLKVKREIEKIYVLTIINKKKGKKEFSARHASLRETLNNTLSQNKEIILQIKKVGDKKTGFFTKIKELF